MAASIEPRSSDPASALARHEPLWGTAAFVFSALFLWLAVSVKTRGTLPWEREFATTVGAWQGSWLDPVMLTLTWLSQAAVIVPAALIAAALNHRSWGVFSWVLALIVAAGPLVEEGLKWWVSRPRPSGLSAGFPSGHTFMATVVLELAVVLVWTRLRSSVGRATAAFAAGLLLVGVAMSRLYLGAHWPADVLGAFLAGTAYVCTAMWLFCRTRAGHRPGALT